MGRPKTGFQVLMAAAVVNLTLLAGIRTGILTGPLVALSATDHFTERPIQPVLHGFHLPGSRPHS
jgi:hypothetical protein